MAQISGPDWRHLNGGPTLPHSIVFLRGVSATHFPFAVGFSLAQLTKGSKKDSEAKRIWGCLLLKEQMGFPGGSDGKESACNVGDSVSIPGSGRTPGRGNGTPLQYSCLENSMGREEWWAWNTHHFCTSQACTLLRGGEVGGESPCREGEVILSQKPD